MALIGCSDPLAPSGKQLTPADGWLYEAECVFYVPEGMGLEFFRQLPSWYWDRCDPPRVVEVRFG